MSFETALETATVWRWETVQPERGGPVIDTGEWWKAQLEKRTREGWRLVDQRPSGHAGCTVYVFTRVVPE
jgi:hypothetical protein